MKISRKKISEKNLDRPATARDFVNLKQDFTDFKTVTSRNFVNLKQDFADFKTVTAKDLQNFVTIDAFKRHMDIIDRRFVEFSERFVSRTEFHEAMDRIYTSLDRIFFLLENKEWEMTKHVVSRHEETLLKHDKRLVRLEALVKA